MKSALVLGAGGFIGSHLVKRLKKDGFWVRGADIKYPDFSDTEADDFVIVDLRKQSEVARVIDRRFEEVYQLAADMGGAGYIFTGENDADVMTNSIQININILEFASKRNIKNIFYSSSACIYPEHNQLDPDNPICSESTAYPANPDSEYGWEKLFSERLYFAYNRNHSMNCCVGRYHNIYGEEGTYFGGKEKVPAALCRKIAKANNEGSIDVWGDGKQTRSFLHINDCVEATILLMRNQFRGPVNIGSEEMISINNLAKKIINISKKELSINNLPGPEGVRGRNSDNKLIEEKLNWRPILTLDEGLKLTYNWISEQITKKLSE